MRKGRQEMDEEICDYCKRPVRPDVNGWWVGDDETSECPADDRGHEVDGSQRA